MRCTRSCSRHIFGAVALKLGYTRAKTLQMHFREVFGLTAGEVRLSLSSEEALRLITERYLRQPSRAAS